MVNKNTPPPQLAETSISRGGIIREEYFYEYIPDTKLGVLKENQAEHWQMTGAGAHLGDALVQHPVASGKGHGGADFGREVCRHQACPRHSTLVCTNGFALRRGVPSSAHAGRAWAWRAGSRASSGLVIPLGAGIQCTPAVYCILNTPFRFIARFLGV
jgi:hypothetical protein